MIEAVSFLTLVGRAIASMRFYHEGHPARQGAVDAAYQAARDLLDRDHLPRFTFADGDVVYHRALLHELRGWEWAGRLENAGIQRLELLDDLGPDDFVRFLGEAATRLAGEGSRDDVERQFAQPGVRYGPLEPGSEPEQHGSVRVHSADASLELDREIEAIQWIHQRVSDGSTLPVLEAEIVARSLATAIHRESQVTLPLLRLRDLDDYTTTHACNVAVLATAFAEHLGFDRKLALALGVCGLLYDIGKVRTPRDLLTRPGRLERSERRIIEQHPIHGARILIEGHRNLELAAIVSFEHHRWTDGSGYPRRRRDHRSHFASRIIQICDVFDALCSDRPYRNGLPPDVALAGIEAEAGTHFHAGLVRQFATLIRASKLRFGSIDEGRSGTAPDDQAANRPTAETPVRQASDRAVRRAVHLPEWPQRDRRSAGAGPLAAPAGAGKETDRDTPGSGGEPARPAAGDRSVTGQDGGG